MKKRIIRGCLRIAILAVAGGVLGWLSSILFGERALITELPVVVTLGASIGILSGVVLFPEKAWLQAAELWGAEDRKQTEELARNAGKGAGYGNQGNYNRQFPG